MTWTGMELDEIQFRLAGILSPTRKEIWDLFQKKHFWWSDTRLVKCRKKSSEIRATKAIPPKKTWWIEKYHESLSFYDLSVRIAIFFFRKKKSHDFSAKKRGVFLAANALFFGLPVCCEAGEACQGLWRCRDWKSFRCCSLKKGCFRKVVEIQTSFLRNRGIFCLPSSGKYMWFQFIPSLPIPGISVASASSGKFALLWWTVLQTHESWFVMDLIYVWNDIGSTFFKFFSFSKFLSSNSM